MIIGQKKNLRFLCPNCNSQQDTFAGRNNKLYDTKYYCLDCHKEISKTSLRCQSCAGIELKKDISKRPDKETLIKDITLMSMVKVGKKYGVSDNAVKKWCKFYGIWHLRKNKKQKRRMKKYHLDFSFYVGECYVYKSKTQMIGVITQSTNRSFL